MQKFLSCLFFAFTNVFLFSTVFVSAGDLQDGISNYRDDSIRAADQLGDPDINFSFIEMRAKSRVSSIISPDITSPLYGNIQPGVLVSPVSGDYSGNINSVILQPGSVINGDIIIIDQSTAEKTLIILGGTSYASGLGLDYELDGYIDDLDDLGKLPDPPSFP